MIGMPNDTTFQICFFSPLRVLTDKNEMLADPWQVDIQELFEASVNEPDEIKKNLYDSLYTYILQKRQEDIINRPGFVI